MIKIDNKSSEKDVYIITLENNHGMKAVLSNYGAVLISLFVPDKCKKPVDVVLGYEDLTGYENNGCCFGATIGRNGNRIENARYTLNGKEYRMHHTEEYRHNCHSMPDTFFTRKWEYRTDEGTDFQAVEFSLYSPNGDQGFPGNMKVVVRYTLTEKNELIIDYFGKSDQDTVMNMTNHSYFNLNGHNSGDILNHQLRIISDYITEVNNELIPSGKLLPVKGTAFDFHEWKTIGQDIHAENEQIRFGHGYDHNFVVNAGKKKNQAELCAECIGDISGIKLKVFTDLPGMQIYTANGLEVSRGKNGAVYHANSGICFETQFAPNAINIPTFEQPIIKADTQAHSRTIFAFE